MSTIQEIEENKHVRLCNAGVNQTIHVWESEEERQEWFRCSKEFTQKLISGEIRFYRPRFNDELQNKQ